MVGRARPAQPPRSEVSSMREPTSQRREAPAWICPMDGKPLEEGDGALLGCDHHFAIHQGVPRFTADDAYAASFGLEWNRFRLTQLDSSTGQLISASRLRRCL